MPSQNFSFWESNLGFICVYPAERMVPGWTGAYIFPGKGVKSMAGMEKKIDRSANSGIK
jgi:hypothetical protein